MGLQEEFKKVKLFSGFIYSDPLLCDAVIKELEDLYGGSDLTSDVFDFDKTTYYSGEMGSVLYKRFISFNRLIPPEELPGIKLLTNHIENRYAPEGNRLINIDPGFLSDANVILATTKNHYHRIPLTKGIYAHMEYVIKKRNTLTVLEWTYPDFRTPQYMDFFKQLILIYKGNIKTERTKESH